MPSLNLYITMYGCLRTYRKYRSGLCFNGSSALLRSAVSEGMDLDLIIDKNLHWVVIIHTINNAGSFDARVSVVNRPPSRTIQKKVSGFCRSNFLFVYRRRKQRKPPKSTPKEETAQPESRSRKDDENMKKTKGQYCQYVAIYVTLLQ